MKRILALAVVLAALAFPVKAEAQYALIASAKSSSPNNTDVNTGGTNGSGAVDTTGADIIYLIRGILISNPCTPDDSAGNTWIPLTDHDGTNGNRIYYVRAPTTSASHTFGCHGAGSYASLVMMAFSGSVASPFDVENGGTTSGGSANFQTGAVLANENGELIVTGLTTLGSTSPTINSGFTIPTNGVATGSGTAVEVAGAYLIQVTAASVNPTWNSSEIVANPAANSIATFKAAGGGGGGGGSRANSFPLLHVGSK